MVECRNEQVQTDERVQMLPQSDVPTCFCQVDLAEQQEEAADQQEEAAEQQEEEAAVQVHTAVMISQRLFVRRPFISVELG